MASIKLQNAVADYLTETIGIQASNEHTGGGIYCILIETPTRLFTFGTSDDMWSADVAKKDANGEPNDLELESLNTAVSSECEDVELVAKGIAAALAQYDLKQAVCPTTTN